VKPAATALLLLWSVLLGAQTSDRAQTETLAARAADRLQVLQREADELASQERTLLRELRRLEVERQIKTEELRKVDAEAQDAARQIEVIDAEVRRLEEQERAMGPELRARVVELYKLGRGRYLRLMLSISDARRFGQASRMLAALAQRDRDRLAEHQRRLDSLATSRQSLSERADRLRALRLDADKARSAAERAVQDRNALIKDIDQQRDLNAQLAGELLTAQESLQARLRDVTADTPSAEPAALPLRLLRGDLDWPVAGGIRQRFGDTSGNRRGMSNGIDIDAAEGSPVRAVHSGTVVFADRFAGYGNLVIVDHGAQTFSLYGNLLDLARSKGDHVDQGESLGTVGYALAGAPGLYFELRVDGRPVDPLQWLKKR
jgi:septal ring factor EnvC (AmiA/AmiB activator)